MGQMSCFDEDQFPTTTTRSVDCTLDPAKYVVGVDAWDTGGARIGYTLDVMSGQRSIEDFYSFTVTGPGTVTLELNVENARPILISISSMQVRHQPSGIKRNRGTKRKN